MKRVLLLLFLCGCVRSVRPLYDAAHDAALAQPGALVDSWRPDAVLQLSAPLVEEVIEAAARDKGALSKAIEIGPARITPELKLRSVSVVDARPCEGGCVGLDASFGGTLLWTAGPLSGRVLVEAHGVFDALFEVVAERDAMVVSVAPRRLRELEVELGGLETSIKGVKKAVRNLIESDALARVPPVPIARFPSSDLPLRAARVVAEPAASRSGAVRVELLTDVPQPGQVTCGAGPERGFAVTFAESTLLGLARKEAFRHGPVAYGVVPEPTALSFGPDGFTLGLRLWRIEGRTWWRDYSIAGRADVASGKLALTPDSVTEGERSKGAVLADPLAALAEGLILEAIEDAVRSSLPLRTQQKIGAASVTVALEGMAPSPGAVRATGSVEITP